MAYLPVYKHEPDTREATQDDFSGHVFLSCEIIILCFVVAMCDLVLAVEAMYGLPQV